MLSYMNKYERMPMSIKKLLLSTSTLLLVAGSLHADNTMGIDINKNDVELFASLNINTLANYADGTTYILDVNYLHSDNDNMSQVGFSGQNNLQGIEGLTFALGLKGVLASDFLAFPLFAKGIYDLPLIDAIPTTSVALTFAYAPKVLSFRDTLSYLEWRLEVDMEVVPNVHAFTGYRNIDTEYDYRDKTFNDSVYLGMKLSF